MDQNGLKAEGCDFVVMHAGREVVRIAAKVYGPLRATEAL
jgi:hypothetical protein